MDRLELLDLIRAYRDERSSHCELVWPIVSGGMSVAPATKDQLPEIVSLDKELWGKWANPLPFYRQLLDSSPHSVLTARTNAGAFAGVAVGLIGSTIMTATVLSIDVDPEHQGVGVGAALLSSLLSYFDWYGITDTTAIIDESNARSRRLFGKFDFECVEELPSYFEEGDLQLRYARSRPWSRGPDSNRLSSCAVDTHPPDTRRVHGNCLRRSPVDAD